MAGLTVYMTGGARAGGYSKATLKGTYIFRGSAVGLFAALISRRRHPDSLRVSAR
jgi:hypothetical protein